MRHAIDRRSRQFKDVLLDDKLRKEFLKGAPKNDAKAVKAFVASNSENALKTRPKVCFFCSSPCSFPVGDACKRLWLVDDGSCLWDGLVGAIQICVE